MSYFSIVEYVIWFDIGVFTAGLPLSRAFYVWPLGLESTFSLTDMCQVDPALAI